MGWDTDYPPPARDLVDYLANLVDRYVRSCVCRANLVDPGGPLRSCVVICRRSGAPTHKKATGKVSPHQWLVHLVRSVMQVAVIRSCLISFLRRQLGQPATASTVLSLDSTSIPCPITEPPPPSICLVG